MWQKLEKMPYNKLFCNLEFIMYFIKLTKQLLKQQPNKQKKQTLIAKRVFSPSPPSSVYFLFPKFILKEKNYNLESLSSPLENTVILLCAPVIVCVCPSFRTQHKRLPMKRKEEELVPGTSQGGLSSPVRESCFPCHFLLQIFLILETSWMQVMISENPRPMRLIVL